MRWEKGWADFRGSDKGPRDTSCNVFCMACFCTPVYSLSFHLSTGRILAPSHPYAGCTSYLHPKQELFLFDFDSVKFNKQVLMRR